MKRYLKDEIAQLHGKIMNDSDLEIISEMGLEDHGIRDNNKGKIYQIRVNGHNVYRVICDTTDNNLIFQCVRWAMNNPDGTIKYLDDAQDYKQSTNTSPSQWYTLIKRWISECENDDPEWTQYEE